MSNESVPRVCACEVDAGGKTSTEHFVIVPFLFEVEGSTLKYFVEMPYGISTKYWAHNDILHDDHEGYCPFCETMNPRFLSHCEELCSFQLEICTQIADLYGNPYLNIDAPTFDVNIPYWGNGNWHWWQRQQQRKLGGWSVPPNFLIKHKPDKRDEVRDDWSVKARVVSRAFDLPKRGV